MALLLDTGPLYALADADDGWHRRVRDFLEKSQELLLVPVTVLPEVTYLMHTRLGPEVERRFVASLAAGELTLEPLAAPDISRAEELLAAYPFLGFVDATVVAIAERLRLTGIVTTDRRHFGAVQPVHARVFELIPD